MPPLSALGVNCEQEQEQCLKKNCLYVCRDSGGGWMDGGSYSGCAKSFGISWVGEEDSMNDAALGWESLKEF